MYSDDWHRAGYTIEERIVISDPVMYRHAYDHEGVLVGVIVDYEFADDYHYELLTEDWIQFCEQYLDAGNETEAFKKFINAKNLDTIEGKFAFEDALKKSGIKFKKVAFY